MNGETVRQLQLERLSRLLHTITSNLFYRKKYASAGLDPATITLPDDWRRMPFTTKAELLADQSATPPYGTNLSFPLEQYCRYNQTSGTSGKPLRWLDTQESWSALLDCWAMIYDVVGVKPNDRLFFPFSFGPFLGFWTAFESATRKGLLSLPGGGMSSQARLRFLLDNQATVVLCTPTYAMHLGEVAREEGIDLISSPVRILIVAGEPGGNIPATRQRIESAWGARVFDHSGMTEVGPATIECVEQPGGLHLLETEYLGEVIDPATGEAVEAGTPGELVITNLRRLGSPLIRYRTGDLVCVDPGPCPCGRPWVRLDGGIRGRVDDMIVLRGNNVYPSGVQTIVHRFGEIVEYRIEVDETGPLAELRIEVEITPETSDGEPGGAPPNPHGDIARRLEQAIQSELLFRPEVRVVAPGTLPRFEMKARRVTRKTREVGTPGG